jgi:DNA helicase HerA-like ATPase
MTETARFSTAGIERLARSIESLMDVENPAQLIGADLSSLAARIPSEQQVTPGAVVRLSLLNDTLCVAERAIGNDGQITPAEVSYMGPLVGETQKYLGRFRQVYRELDSAEERGVQHFLEQHASDGQKFGGRCESTAWIGLSLCKRAAELTGDGHFVDEYRELVVRMLDDLFGGVGSGSESDKRAVVQELNLLAPPAAPARDPRDAAYCSSASPEVFHAVAHGAEVFTPDPFDVEQIHAEARVAFSRLLDRAGDSQFGKMLLVKGVAGSGKTHLMRAFRNQVHGEQLGFVAYLQMSTRVKSYSRYLLANLVDSWDRPYWGEVIPEPALSCLSDSLGRDLSPELLERLRDEATLEEELDVVVQRAADELCAQDRYRGSHPDVLRVLLYLQRRDPARRARALKFLRCEGLTPYDRKLLGDTPAFDDEHAAPRMLAELGRLVAASGNGALVLLVDQLEDIYNLDEAPVRFRLAMDALRQLADHVPNSVIVVACLDDFYIELRSALARPMLDRLERDPDPVQLTANRSLAEIEALIAPRLSSLFERQNVLVREDQRFFPFDHTDLEALVNQRTRDVLDWCRTHHEASIRAGGLVIFSPRPGTEAPPVSDGTLALEQAWNDHFASSHAVPRDEADMVSLVAWALGHVWREVPGLPRVQTHVDGTYVDARVAESKLGLALCDRNPAGGALGRQVDALRRLAAATGSTPIMLRSSEYPRPGKSQVAEKLKLLLSDSGRRVLITDAEWRRMLALKLFLTTREDGADIDVWLERERPISGLNAIVEILELDSRPQRRPPERPSVRTLAPSAVARSSVPPASRPSLPPPPVVYRVPRASVAPGNSFAIGQTRSLNPRSVDVNVGSFVTHAAFLGSSKSGKTTLALSIIEHLLELGVPALLVDRKGDLASYASRDSWYEEADSPELTARKRALQGAVDVCVFTPGEPRGRALELPVVPSGLGELPAHERGIAARYAASALGAMMGYGKAKSDQARLGILGKAIELVGQGPEGESLGIREIVSVLDSEDPDLVASIGKLDPKHFRALVENLETLRLRYEHLLRGGSERLSPELLFGLGEEKQAGRTRLSIISTKFLGDNAAIDFWVTRLIGELGRFASRSPSDHLQAVVFLDEADIYLPAQSKPATKEPLLDLLRRARAAGIGVMLATESPGDLDYRCRDNIRTWFVGRVAEKNAVDKMKPLLSECRINVGARLAAAKTGEFFKLEEGDVVELKAQPSLMKVTQLSEEAILEGARQSKAGDRQRLRM